MAKNSVVAGAQPAARTRQYVGMANTAGTQADERSGLFNAAAERRSRHALQRSGVLLAYADSSGLLSNSLRVRSTDGSLADQRLRR